uniref:TEA domain-containing protein n=1 Tax=Prolemur simus TaxID=1328070 RepID=A0A8C8YXE6_PROSS
MEQSCWKGSEEGTGGSEGAGGDGGPDAEGVWSPDIEQSFQEALAIYPPCGRWKIILSDEGKMYGRNELITQTRKQVSSHIQVLTRRKSREIQSKLKALNVDQVSKDKAFQTMATMSSAQLISAPSLQTKLGPAGPQASKLFQFWSGGSGPPWNVPDVKPFSQTPFSLSLTPPATDLPGYEPPKLSHPSLGTARLQLVEFSAFVEPPDAVDSYQSSSGGFYGVSSQYESLEHMTLTCSSKVCSFGKQVVEKVEKERAQLEDGRFVYPLLPSPMCEYLVNFLHKLRQLPEPYMMNSVLENFTILQVVTNRDTQELLLCTAYIFEVSTSEHGAQHHIYRLVRD